MAIDITVQAPNLFEERVAVACCHSDTFLEKYVPLHDVAAFSHFELGEIVQWCVEYYGEYKCSPGQQLTDILDSRRAAIPDTVLPRISSAVKRVAASEEKENTEYLFNKVRTEFRLRQARKVHERLSAAIDLGDIDSVEEALQENLVLEADSYTGVNPFASPDIVRDAFDATTSPLFRLPGALGKRLNPFLMRKSFMAFTGPEKRGKTYLLFYLARYAYKARCNVLVIQAGDLSQEEGIQRLYTDIAGKNTDPTYCGRQFTPVVDCMKNQFNTCCLSDRTSTVGLFKDEEEYDEVVEAGYSKEDIFHMAKAGYKPCSACRYKCPQTWAPGVFYEETLLGEDALDYGEAWRAAAGMRYLTRGCHFALCTYANSSISMTGVSNLIARIERKEGWVPDVVVIDYMDILDDEPRVRDNLDFRHKDDSKWKRAKRLAQDWNCLLVSASQGTRASHKKGSLDTDDISENKRRLAHVNFMGALNQTPDEKRRGLLRIGTILQRSGASDAMDEVAVLQCLERGRAVVDSFAIKVRENHGKKQEKK
jgi:hypothetical protein